MPNVNLLNNLSTAIPTQAGGQLTPSASFGLQQGREDEDIVQSLQNYAQQQHEIIRLQFPLDLPKYHFYMSFSTYVRRSLGTIGTPNDGINGAKVILPVPMGLTDTHEVSYTEEKVGFIEGQFFNRGIEAAQSIARGTGSVGGTVAGIVEGATGIAGGAAVGGVQAIQALGLSANEWITILLDAPTYKRFSLSWHLVPRNFQEANRIKEIIMYLNNAMSPGLALGGSIFAFPKVVSCALLPNYGYLYRFKPSVINSMQIDYAPGGNPAFYHDAEASDDRSDNPPESVRLTMNFIELEYWLKGDFKDETFNAFATRGSNEERAATTDIDLLTDNSVVRAIQGEYNKWKMFRERRSQ